MNLLVFIALIFVLQAICLAAATKFSKGMKSQDDYFLAGKGLRFFPLMMTFVATQVGGGVILGAAEEAYQFGWSVLFYPLGCCLGLIFLAIGIGRKMAELNVPTIAQVFEKVYHSSGLKKVASGLSILSLFMIFIAQLIASKKFLLSLGVESNALFIGFWTLVILYTVMGGLRAVVITDVIQATFFIITFFFCFGFAFYYNDLSLAQIVSFNADAIVPADSGKMVSWLMLPLLFMVIEQDMGQRCFAASSPKIVSSATLVAAITMASVCIIPVFFGVWARSLGIEVAPGASVLMTIVQQTTTPLVSAIVGCAILAAIISTADSLINAISSNVSQDFDLSFLKIKNHVTMARGITAAIALFGIVFSFYFDNIVGLLIQSYDLSVSCLFVPVFFALFRQRGHARSATLSILFGACGFCLFKVVPLPFGQEIASILLSALGYGLGEVRVRSPSLFFTSEISETSEERRGQ
jgi:SSS family solute:Na+ symporter